MSMWMRTSWISLVALGLCALAACKSEDDQGPISGAAWSKTNKPAVDKLRKEIEAAAALAKDLPAITQKVSDPDPPLKPIESWEEGENAVIVAATGVPGMPEFADASKADDGLRVAFTGYVDLESAFSMVDKGVPRFASMTTREGVGLAKQLAKLRYIIISREVSYDRGLIDKRTKTYLPGRYNGVAHIIDLQGPKHLGSVDLTARNTASFESTEGAEASTMKSDLQGAVIREFYAELAKMFPKSAVMPPLPPALQQKPAKK